MIYWPIAIVVSILGMFLIWDRAGQGYMDFSGLFYLPAGVCWFLFCWLIYFAAT